MVMKRAEDEQTERLKAYDGKDYSEIIEFPVELVDRDGVVRRYSYEESLAVYHRRIQSSPWRYADDDLIRAEGAGGVQAVLDRALPMVQLLWKRETEGRVFDSPERKAALDKALREAVLTLRADPALCQRLGEEGRRQCQTAFAANTMVENLQQVYDDVLEHNHS